MAVIGAMIHSPFTVRQYPGAELYFQNVQHIVKDIPYKIGPWLARDVDVAPAAVRLLKPNIITQRQYTDTNTGRSIQLLIVHCGDTRDMQGHYPPVCYPAHGWSSIDVEKVSIEVGGSSLPARRYRFTRLNEGVESHLDVLDFFVMPGGLTQFHGDISALNRASRSTRGAGLGAAQIQLVAVNPNFDMLKDGVAKELISGIERALHVIAQGVPDGA